MTIERSLPNDRLTPGRQIGGMLYGSFAGGRFGYSAGAFNGSGTNIGNNDNDRFMWVGRANVVVHQGKIGHDSRSDRRS